MSAENITIFTAEAQAGPVGRPTAARGDAQAARLGEAVEVSVDVMEKNVTSFVESVSSMIEAADNATVGDVSLETVEIAVQIGADGKVGFMGIGLAANASSSMKIVFKRKD